MSEHTTENDAPGAWLVYDHDMGPYAISLHDSAPSAARDAARQGYGRVGFWPFGMELREAVDLWEGRVTPPGSPAAPAPKEQDRG